MKYILVLILAAIMLSSCNPCKRLAQRCPPNIVVRDSIIEKTVTSLRDTLIFVKIPGLNIIDSVPVPCPPQGNNYSATNQRLTVNGKFSTASSWIFRDKLYLELIEGDTLLPVKLENAIRETSYWKDRYYSKETVTVIPWRWWERAFFFAGIITIVLSVIIWGFKLYQFFK